MPALRPVHPARALLLLTNLALLALSAAAVQCSCQSLYYCPSSRTITLRKSDGATCAEPEKFVLAVRSFFYECGRFLDICDACILPTAADLRRPLPLEATSGICRLSNWRLALLIVLIVGAFLFFVILAVFGHLEWHRYKQRRARRVSAAAGYCEAVREASVPTAFLPIGDDGRSDSIMLAIPDPEETEAAVAVASNSENLWEKVFGRRKLATISRKRSVAPALFSKTKRRRRRGESGDFAAERESDMPSNLSRASTENSTIISEDDSPVTSVIVSSIPEDCRIAGVSVPEDSRRAGVSIPEDRTTGSSRAGSDFFRSET